MSQTKARPTIGVFGHYGVGNLGDEAIIASVIQALPRYLPEAELVCFSLNAEDSARRHGVRAYPIRRLHRATDEPVTRDEDKDSLVESVRQRVKNALKRFPTLVAMRRGIGGILSFARNCIPESYFLFQAYRRLKDVDALLISGSGQLNDSYDGAGGFPYTLLKWSLLTRLTGTRLAFVSVGAEEVASSLSKRFLRWALRQARYRSYRDPFSLRMVATIGLNGPHRVVPDLAIGLEVPQKTGNETEKSSFTVGFNAIPYCDPRYWPEEKPDVYARYVEKQAQLVSWLIGQGHTVTYFSTKDVNDDLVANDMLTVLSASLSPDELARFIKTSVATLSELFAVLSDCDLAVASRYHGTILPMIMGIPTIGLGYNPKTQAVMDLLSVGEYCFNIATTEVEAIQEAFLRLAANRRRIAQQLTEGRQKQLHKLEKQWRDIAALIDADK